MRLKTLIIDRDGVAVTINATDFKEGRDVLWSDKPKKTKKKATKKRAAKK